MAERSSDPKVAYPDVKIQVRGPVRVVPQWVLLNPFAPLGAGTHVKFVLSSSREKMGAG